MTVQTQMIETVLSDYPDTQAIYLFGSWGTEDEWPTSDVDMAILLPPPQAKTVDFWAWNALAMRLESIVHKSVDLLNVRRASTVFQKEVIMADRRIFCADEVAADEFEMLTFKLRIFHPPQPAGANGNAPRILSGSSAIRGNDTRRNVETQFTISPRFGLVDPIAAGMVVGGRQDGRLWLAIVGLHFVLAHANG